jgi:alpha-methylacyl-CoA racemase
LAMDAARVLAGGAAPPRGRAPLAGGLICYRPYRCADGWITLGALEPKFWQAWCAGVGRADLADRQFDPVGSDTHRAVEEAFAARTRDEWQAFNDEHDCCVEPVLDLDEALARSGDMVVEAGSQRLLGTPVRLSRTPADPTRAGGPAIGADTDAVLAEAGYAAAEIGALREAGAIG